jgi:hypothetical protein
VVAPPAPADQPAASLLEWLRARTDTELAELFRGRPDLALPAPADLPTLAARLAVRTSVQRAVDGLDAHALIVLEALVLTSDGQSPTSRDTLAGLLDDPAIDRPLERLRTLLLLWGEDDGLHAVATVRECLGAYPAGIGRPAAGLFAQVPDVTLAPVLRSLGLPPASQPRAGAAVAAVLRDRDRLAELLTDTSDHDEREVLSRLAAGPPVGRVRGGPDENVPARRLSARGLLAPLDALTVELPREVGVALRGEHPLGTVLAEPPTVETEQREPAELDRSGSTAVLDVLRLVDALAEEWTARPPAQLRSGGLGVRELRRTAKALGVDESGAGLIAELACAAGLVNATHAMEPAYLPTAEYDTWRRRPAAARWADLALAWLNMTRQPSLVGQRGERDRLITALGPDAERGSVPALRQQLLATLLALPPGARPIHRDAVLQRLAWQAPRRAAGSRAVADAILAEADVVGITAAGGLTGYSRTLLVGSRTVAEQVLGDALPDPVDHFLVQPDLTLVVPGPPTAELAAELAVLADLESTGGASVYRVTESSIRRALDAGRSGAAVAALIAQRSRTPVPQALQYLVDDLARRHGALRTGTASSYLRCDDEALLARVVNDRGIASLQLQRLAPTVAITSAPVGRILEVLREAGYAPAAEDADRALVAVGAQPPRAPSRPPVRVVRTTNVTDGPRLAELVQRVRSGDALTELSRTRAPVAAQLPGVTSAATMGTLRAAIREGRRVLLGLADADGLAARYTMAPISMAGGFVRGHVPGEDALRSFPLHRITAVTVLADPDTDAEQ